MQLKGYCYLCGAELSKSAMKNHIMKYHVQEGATPCALVKVESDLYWLYVAAPLTCTLGDMDQFLRDIWLECCNHLSEFNVQGDRFELPLSIPWADADPDVKLIHQYDFGSTTECLLTVVDHVPLPFDKVDLVARNVPMEYPCRQCGKPAAYILTELVYDEDDPYVCEECAEQHDGEYGYDMMSAITNSPRMGVCGYEGEMDRYNFRPEARELPKKITRGRKKAASPDTPS